MKTIASIEEMKKWTRRAREDGKEVGLVPTMGCLHEGHLSLVRSSVDECDVTVVSIFVNPTQFGPNEDFASYPRTLETDKALLRSTGADVLFCPDRKTLYPDGFQTFVQVEEKTRHLCGKNRPGFFRGVTTIVLKLFNIVHPHKAFFGEKDWQQLEVIKTLVRDLNLDVSIIGKQIVREKSGLAMSSRNKYLSEDDRESALSLSQALESARDRIGQGEICAETIRAEIRRTIEQKKGTEVDYISVCDPENFTEQDEIGPRTLITLAVRIGKARLIDNCIVERT
ncbi:pantoate--beta-alanine ligase [Candidatus Nitromaritima sp. SCGC AAA799-C22]|nr:pantoate--beta-alanine ligase [Candidatus Nitromaritima sp. SCGC AAA799-C22]